MITGLVELVAVSGASTVTITSGVVASSGAMMGLVVVVVVEVVEGLPHSILPNCLSIFYFFKRLLRLKFFMLHCIK